MMVFTSVTVTFIPPTLMTGLFGMNVKIPFADGWQEEVIPEDATNWERFEPYLPFTVIIIFGLGLSIGLLKLFRNKKII